MSGTRKGRRARPSVEALESINLLSSLPSGLSGWLMQERAAAVAAARWSAMAARWSLLAARAPAVAPGAARPLASLAVGHLPSPTGPTTIGVVAPTGPPAGIAPASPTASLAPSATTPIVKAHAAATKPAYIYNRLGSAADVAPRTTFGVALEGGVEDVDSSFTWMSKLANGGDFLVIQFDTTDLGYNPYILDLSKKPGGKPLNSVATLMIPSRDAANDPNVAKIIDQAEAIYIGGGDQSNYIQYWSGTETQKALQRAVANNHPIGGISAGMAVLGEYVYSSLYQSSTSDKSLANPFDRNLTLAQDFLPIDLLRNIITDTHFENRDRMGRLVTFLARIANDYRRAPVHGIGVNAGTALLIDNEGLGTVVSRSGYDPNYPASSTSVYFLSGPAITSTDVVQPKTPLTYHSVEVTKVTPGGEFDLGSWSSDGDFAKTYTLDAVQGTLIPSGASTIYG